MRKINTQTNKLCVLRSSHTVCVTKNDILKLQRQERGEVIPEASEKEIGHTAKAKFSTDAPQNNTSPIKQADRTPLRK